MAHNLKAGLMATTTMVGSAMAYTQALAGGEGSRNTTSDKQLMGEDNTQQHKQNWGGNQNQNQTQNEGAKYKDTFHQMMMWRY